MIAETDRRTPTSVTMASANETSGVASKFPGPVTEGKEKEADVSPASTNGAVDAGETVTAKEDEVRPHSSDDDDDYKLVINEINEKRDAPRPQANETARASPKNALKRQTDDEEEENPSKKPRITIEPVQDKPPTSAEVAQSISFLKKDLEGLEVLLKQKEEEWNALLRLQKKKEEAYLRLLRKRQTLMIQKQDTSDKKQEEETERDSSIVFLPDGCFSSLGGSQIPSVMMRHYLGGMAVPQIVTQPSFDVKSSHSSNGPVSSSPSNVSVIDIHTSNSKPFGMRDPPQISISPETHTKLGKQMSQCVSSMKPILPKPLSSGTEGPINNIGSGAQVSVPPTGFGPQGPTVSVHHLIAAYRRENPNIPPIRGAKRGAWRYRFDSDGKRSSSREPDRPSSVSSSSSDTDVRVNASISAKANNSSSNSTLLPMNDPSVSYKDVLLQFAQLTQTEKQPGSPQISIIPVGSGDSLRKPEPIPDSTSVSRELPVSSQPTTQGNKLEGTSALAKLLLESGGNSQGSISKSNTIDLSPSNSSSSQYLTLSALLSGGTTTTVKEKSAPASQADGRSKKSSEESNSNPKCQGCHKSRAQFVCAGCGNQWYCSRECQVSAWEEHSEHCSN